MLRLLRLGCFDGLSLFRGQPSIRCLAATTTCRHQIRMELSDSPAVVAADEHDRWVMLSKSGVPVDDKIVVDPNTVAESRTSTGRPLRVCFGRAAPPASSFVYYDWPNSTAGDEVNDTIDVIAAHGDSALLQMRDRRRPDPYRDNQFVYRIAGVGATTPASLTLLPPRDHQVNEGQTALLRRGDELLVVQHKLHDMYDDVNDRQRLRTSFFEYRSCVQHRHGTTQWGLQHVVPVVRKEDIDEYPSYEMKGWATITPIPVGGRFLCCVQSESHFLLADMADEASTRAQYVPLPPDLSRCGEEDDEEDDTPCTRRLYSKNLCAAGASQVKFVRVERRSCCGGPGRSTCERSRFAFTVNTWTMNLNMDEPLTWVKDGVLDCEEIWALPGYEGLPRAYLESPVVSLDDPDIICFTVTDFELIRGCNNYKVWTIKLNMRSKTLMSVVKYATDPWRAYCHLPARLQC